MSVYSFSSPLKLFLCVSGCFVMFPVFSVYASEKHHHHAMHSSHVKGYTYHVDVRHNKHVSIKQQREKSQFVSNRNRAFIAAAGGVGVAAVTASAMAGPTSSVSSSDLPTAAIDHKEPTKGTVTGLPLPRYAALRADEVNIRVGPGERFPILWVYHRRGLPVRIEREFDTWRLVEDESGQKGWVQQAILVNNRDFLVPGDKTAISSEDGKDVTFGHTKSRVVGYVLNQSKARAMHGVIFMYENAQDTAPIVAVLQPGTVGSIKACAAESPWCKVSVHQYTGWVARKDIWGVDNGESVGHSIQ